MPQPRSILWRRLDQPGHDAARLVRQDAGWQLGGSAIFAHERAPCRLDYLVVCDRAWHTVSARVAGWVETEPVEIALSVDPAGRWRRDGVECAAVGGCLDVDLAFTPATNLLPIRRLGLAVGQAAAVRAAWLGFPGFALEPLDQIYRRLDVSRYRYESGGGRFVRELEVDAEGLVTRYPGLWEREAAG